MKMVTIKIMVTEVGLAGCVRFNAATFGDRVVCL